MCYVLLDFIALSRKIITEKHWDLVSLPKNPLNFNYLNFRKIEIRYGF